MSTAAGFCITALGEGATNPILNKYKNTGVTASELDGLATCTLEDYGESKGLRCGSCCFESISNPRTICALVLHNCATGEIIDWQIPPKGLSCPEGEDVVCLDLTKWCLPNYCPPPENVEVDLACMDPCKLWKQLRQARLMLLVEKCQVSWKTGSKSGSYRPQDYNALLCAETEAREECQNCGGGTKTLLDVPGCY